MEKIALFAFIVLISGCICCGGDDFDQNFGDWKGLQGDDHLTPDDDGVVSSPQDPEDVINDIVPDAVDPETYEKPLIASTTTLKTTPTIASTTTLDEQVPQDLRSILSSGDSYYCTFSDKKTLSDTWRYQLWSNQWMYYSSVDQGRGAIMNILYDQEYQYVWYKGRPLGTRYSISGIKGSTGQVERGDETQVWYLLDYLNPDHVKDLICERKDFSEDKLEKPSNVRWQEGKSSFDNKQFT